MLSAGNHSHNYLDYYWHDSGGVPEFETPTGDGVGQRLQASRVTNGSGAHTHALGGQVGATGVGVDGDLDQAVTGDMEHVSLRLRVKS